MGLEFLRGGGGGGGGGQGISSARGDGYIRDDVRGCGLRLWF